jgi:hypothetical protein
MTNRSAAVLAIILLLSSGANADAPGTMRLDYFHSGNRDMEMFSVEQVVIEPMPWTGNMHQPIDQTHRGKYLFEIVDNESGDITRHYLVTQFQQHLR